MKKKVIAVILSLCMILGMIPVHMEHFDSQAEEKETSALSVDAPSDNADADFREVIVYYVDENGKVVSSKSENIAYGKWTYYAEAPEGYVLFDTNNVISIDDNTTDIHIEVRAKEKKSVLVTYKTSSEMVKGTERITVDADALEIRESSLKRVPGGYKVVSISAIEDNAVTAIVEKISTTKNVKANYICNGEKVGEEELTVADDATTVTEDQLTIPEKYKFVSASNITSRGTVDVKVKRQTKSIVVKYETSTGMEKGRERIAVDIDATEISESDLEVPEGLKVVSISAIKNKTVVVVVEAVPTTKDVKAVYVCDGNKIGDEKVTVAADATTVTEGQLTIPENYKFVSASNITSKNIVTVKIARKTKSVVVKYETSSGMEKFRERIDVDIEATEVSEADLNVPSGYNVVSISAIKNKTVVVVVEEIPTKEIKVNYICNGKKVGSETINIAEDATTVTEDQLTIPDGYELETITNITSKGRIDVKVSRKTSNASVYSENEDKAQVVPVSAEPVEEKTNILVFFRNFLRGLK